MSARLDAAIRELADALLDELRAAATPDAPDRLLDVEEAAALLALGRSKVYAELAAGRLRSLRVGRRRLVPASAVASYIKEKAGPVGENLGTPSARRLP